MPGNVLAASPVGVFPKLAYVSFVESRSVPMLTVGYHDPTIERRVLDDGVNLPQGSLRTWKLSARLIASALVSLRTFFEAHIGIPFYWYNPMEPASGQPTGSNYDGTGASIQGRHVCIFRSQQWSEVVGMARVDVSFDLAEVA